MDTVADGQLLTMTLLFQWLGDCTAPWPINSEVGDFSGEVLGGRGLYSSLNGMTCHLTLVPGCEGISVGILRERELEDLRRIDNPAAMAKLYEMASAIAEVQVKASHFF